MFQQEESASLPVDGVRGPGMGSQLVFFDPAEESQKCLNHVTIMSAFILNSSVIHGIPLDGLLS